MNGVELGCHRFWLQSSDFWPFASNIGFHIFKTVYISKQYTYSHQNSSRHCFLGLYTWKKIVRLWIGYEYMLWITLGHNHHGSANFRTFRFVG
jgi:hypothetical protein